MPGEPSYPFTTALLRTTRVQTNSVALGSSSPRPLPSFITSHPQIRRPFNDLPHAHFSEFANRLAASGLSIDLLLLRLMMHDETTDLKAEDGLMRASRVSTKFLLTTTIVPPDPWTRLTRGARGGILYGTNERPIKHLQFGILVAVILTRSGRLYPVASEPGHISAVYGLLHVGLPGTVLVPVYGTSRYF
jgi:hypothetical protein